MDIYAILSSKPHNPHYLNRYIKFIKSCVEVNKGYSGYTEKHHICPKADDMFPEYYSFYKNKWNCAVLTPRQHFIAHMFLWKTYPTIASCSYCVLSMSHIKNMKINTKMFSILREEHSKQTSVAMSIRNRKSVEEGTHMFLGKEFNKKRVQEGTHNFLGGEIQRNSNRRRIENNTHHWLGPDFNKKRVEEGNHNWAGPEAAEKQRKIQNEKVASGKHHFLNSLACYDKLGKSVRIPKEVYYNQTGPIEDRQYAHVCSREGKKRKGLVIL
jgi:hypothetical protein